MKRHTESVFSKDENELIMREIEEDGKKNNDEPEKRACDNMQNRAD
jgi:hypothetical protein